MIGPHLGPFWGYSPLPATVGQTLMYIPSHIFATVTTGHTMCYVDNLF